MKLTKSVQEAPPTVDISSLFLSFMETHRNVFITKIDEHVFLYRSVGRKEYRDLLLDSRFHDLEKEEILCRACLLYPDPDTFPWDTSDAGLISKLFHEMVVQSKLDSLESRLTLRDYYRHEMHDLDNQITCIINEGFPQIDIEEIETWDIDKTMKYLSRAEWKLHHLRGIPFVEPRGDFEGYETSPLYQKETRPKEKGEDTTHRGTSKKERLTPEKMKERAEFLKKFPEFSNDDVLMRGIDGLAQDDVDTLPPALRVGF